MKRKLGYGLFGLTVMGLTLSAQTLATYIEDLGEISQTIQAVEWDVELNGNLGHQYIRPGQTVSSDVVTLTNNNTYPVRFAIELKSMVEDGTQFSEVLTFELSQDVDDQTIAGEYVVSIEEITDTMIEVIVPGKASPTAEGVDVVLTSDVEWMGTDDINVDITYQGQAVTYTYEVIAYDAYEEVAPVDEEVVSDDSVEQTEETTEDTTESTEETPENE